jgi:hypothetical protein
MTQKAVTDATDRVVSDVTGVSRKRVVERDSTVVGRFDLSNLLPEKISVEPPNGSDPKVIKTGPRLKITAISAIPNVVTVDGQDSLEVFGFDPLPEKTKETFGDRLALATTPSKSPDTVSEITIDFATQEMADRQAKAWKAAITGCGGKAVSDKLF